MFLGCYSLESVDLSYFDTESLRQTASMFKGCENLKEIKGLDQLHMENAIYTSAMFQNCDSLTYFDLSNFQLDSVKTYGNLFDSDAHVDDPIPTIIITEDEKLIERYNDPDSIKGRIPYFGNASFDANGGVFAEGSTKQFAVVNDETNHFIYANEAEIDQAKASVSAVPGTDILMNNPSTSLSKEGSVFNGWYLDEA